MELSIGWLYPKLMSTYGDRGNVICVQRRCQWRNIEVSIVPLDREADAAQFNQVDIIVGGGAQDRQQEIVMRDLQGSKATAFRNKIEAGHPRSIYLWFSPTYWDVITNQLWGKKLKV